jgi:hypothetical protein
MYEKGSSVKVTVSIGDGGVKELDFIGKVVIDGNDFMAVQFDTIIIPKMDIKAAEPIPEGQDLEQVVGADKSSGGAGVERPKPPKVGDVRFLSLESESHEKKPAKPSQTPGQQRPAQQRPAQQPAPKQHPGQQRPGKPPGKK